MAELTGYHKIIADLAERSPIIIQNSGNPSSRGYTNATALSSSPVVSALGSESDDPGSSPSRGKALCPRDVREKKQKKKKENKKKGKYPESQ